MSQTVTVNIQVEVDKAAWADAYGETPNAATVKEYVVNQIAQCAAAEEGAILEVKRR